jgi:hypothetical protein
MPQATSGNKKNQTETTKPEGEKAQPKALMDRLTGAGEDALQRISELPGGTRALTAFNDLRNRVDELTKKVRGIDALEVRVAKLEKQVGELKGQAKAARKPPSGPKIPPAGPKTPPPTP